MSDKIPQRQFTAKVGNFSKELAGPEQIEKELDQIYKMFNPNTDHLDGIDGGIGEGNLKNDSVTENKIKDNSITTSKVANLSITEEKLADGSIGSEKLKNSSVEGKHIKDKSINNYKIVTHKPNSNLSEASRVGAYEDGGYTAILDLLYSLLKAIKGDDGKPTFANPNIDLKTVKEILDNYQLHKTKVELDHPNESVTDKKIKRYLYGYSDIVDWLDEIDRSQALETGHVGGSYISWLASIISLLKEIKGDGLDFYRTTPATLKGLLDSAKNHRENKIIDHPDKSITTSKMADKSITNIKLADNSVDNIKLVDNSVSDEKIGTRNYNWGLSNSKALDLTVHLQKLWDEIMKLKNLDDNEIGVIDSPRVISTPELDIKKADKETTYTKIEVTDKLNLKADKEVTYTKSQVDNEFVRIKNEILAEVDRKEPVQTYNNLYTTYPNAEVGWLAITLDTGHSYKFDGIEWVYQGEAIPFADENTNGLMRKGDYSAVRYLVVKTAEEPINVDFNYDDEGSISNIREEYTTFEESFEVIQKENGLITRARLHTFRPSTDSFTGGFEPVTYEYSYTYMQQQVEGVLEIKLQGIKTREIAS